MIRPTILVTGATGKTGAEVVSQLRARDWPVRALVHTDDERAARLRESGAQTAVADLFDPDQLLAAMRGTTRAYFCPPWHPHMLQGALTFAMAARQAKLEAIVGLSQWLASPSHPSLATRQNWLVEQMFDSLPGIAHVVVAPPFFADNYLRLIGFASQLGVFPMPLGAGRNAPPSNEDIARVVVAALTEPERHAGRRYRPTGPALLSAREMAAILERVVGRRVRHVEIPMWMFLRALRVLGIDQFQQSGLRHYIDEHNRGTFAMGAPTGDVEAVTGHAPEDFATIARRYARKPDVQRTFGNRARALRDFMRIGLTPAQDLDRFERLQQHPGVASPLLAGDSKRWLGELTTGSPGAALAAQA